MLGDVALGYNRLHLLLGQLGTLRFERALVRSPTSHVWADIVDPRAAHIDFTPGDAPRHLTGCR